MEGENTIQSQLMLGYDGILGQEFFTQYTIEVDTANHKINLYPIGTDLSLKYRASHKLYMQDTAPHVRLTSKLPWEESPSLKEVLVDTGYPGAMVIWNKNHYNSAAKRQKKKDLIAENKGIVTRASFRFGKLFFRNTPIFLGAIPPFQSGERDGIIGGNILNNFKYAIDFKSQKLWMLSRAEEGNRFLVIDSAIYPPNDEDFVIQDFKEIPSSILKRVIQ